MLGQQRRAIGAGECTPQNGNVYTNGSYHTATGGYGGTQDFTILCGADWPWSSDDQLESHDSPDLFNCTSLCVAWNTAPNDCCISGKCIGVSWSVNWTHPSDSQCRLHKLMHGPGILASSPVDSARVTDFV